MKRMQITLGKHDPIRFNLMVVGESGLGKSTFIETLLDTYLPNPVYFANPSVHTDRIAEIGNFCIETDTGEVIIHLFDTPGYGDHINNQDCFDIIRQNLEARHLHWRNLDAQVMSERFRLQEDTRIHCVMYFISPHRMKDIDIEFINQLSDIVPIIPIISKADSMTDKERELLLKDVESKLLNISSSKGFFVNYDFEEIFESEDNVVPTQVVETSKNLIRASESVIDSSEVKTALDENDSCIEDIDAVNNDFLSVGLCSQSYYRVGEALSLLSKEDFQSNDNDKSSNCSDNRNCNLSSYSQDNDQKSNWTGVTTPRGSNEIKSLTKLFRIHNIFAIIASKDRIRSYTWGKILIDDESASDFVRLQKLLFQEGKHIRGLKDSTQVKTIQLNCLMKTKNTFANKVLLTAKRFGVIFIHIANLIMVAIQLLSMSVFLQLSSDPEYFESEKIYYSVVVLTVLVSLITFTTIFGYFDKFIKTPFISNSCYSNYEKRIITNIIWFLIVSVIIYLVISPNITSPLNMDVKMLLQSNYGKHKNIDYNMCTMLYNCTNKRVNSTSNVNSSDTSNRNLPDLRSMLKEIRSLYGF